MDIRFLNQAPSGRATELDLARLLPRLRAAGTVEAVVISRLADSLLLQTPLGRIETTNRLLFQPGDRLELRVSGPPEQPVLKVRDATPRPQVLNIAANPRLLDVLPIDRAALATIVQIRAETTLIRIADQLLTLPTRLEQPRGQLLSLARNPAAQTVSIEPIERKRLYLALIRQLLPRQLESRPVDLVRFYQLAVEVERAQTGRQARGIQLPAGLSSPAGRADLRSGGRPATPDVAAQARESVTLTQGRDAATAVLSRTPLLARPLPARTLSVAPGATFRRLQPAPWQSAVMRQTATGSAVSAHPAAAQANSTRTAFAREASIALVGADPKPAKPLQSGFAAAFAQPAVRSAGSAGRPVNTSIESALPMPRRPASNGTGLTSNRPAVSPAQPPLPAANPPGSAVTGPAGPGLASASAPLSRLLAAVPTLQQLDAPTLRRWFEDLGFIRPAGAAPARSGSSGPLPLLQVLKHGDSLLRELLNLATPLPRSGAEKEARKARGPAPETLLPWVREGIKLVEQALSQNLLQRASLGLQQEAQQPASLGFALPVLDQQQVKPLQIELAQKQSARDGSGSAWEVQIDFEFAGLGPVSCHVVLDGFSVAASFYCALEQTRERVEQALPELRRQLDAAGFVAAELHGFTAAASPARATAADRVDDALLDVEA